MPRRKNQLTAGERESDLWPGGRGSGGADKSRFSRTEDHVSKRREEKQRNPAARYPANSDAMSVALWPPKPKELLIATLTFASRAVLAT
jgi:hypothetical protein